MIRLAHAFSAGCISLAVAALTATAASAAEPGAANDKTQAGSTPAASTGAPAGSGKEGPTSPAQGAVTSDLEKGRQTCSGLADDQAREACEARAAATAESPRGRDGANPTGSGPVKPASPASGTMK